MPLPRSADSLINFWRSLHQVLANTALRDRRDAWMSCTVAREEWTTKSDASPRANMGYFIGQNHQRVCRKYLAY
ncbi:hypothetical protein KCP78_17320 [Salmonella enterica subsp. enterica]|nr:hypothetical protein KCP78_17320 [Salmonella enterica subsp. enterica]